MAQHAQDIKFEDVCSTAQAHVGNESLCLQTPNPSPFGQEDLHGAAPHGLPCDGKVSCTALHNLQQACSNMCPHNLKDVQTVNIYIYTHTNGVAVAKDEDASV